MLSFPGHIILFISVCCLAPIEKKLIQHRLRWFGHVQRRPPEAPVRSGILSQDSNVKRSRGRPKLTWVEAIKGDLKGWNIPKDLALDRSAWKTAIHVPEPWLLLLGFNSSLPQLIWDLKALLLLLLLLLLLMIFTEKICSVDLSISSFVFTGSLLLFPLC